MIKEFKNFLMRGNVLDMAVGVVLGGAFTKVVTSFTNDVLMPPIGLALGKMDFSNLFINLSSESYSTLADAKKAGAPTLNIGIFANVILDFIILSFAMYLILKAVSRVRGKDGVIEAPK